MRKVNGVSNNTLLIAGAGLLAFLILSKKTTTPAPATSVNLGTGTPAPSPTGSLLSSGGNLITSLTKLFGGGSASDTVAPINTTTQDSIQNLNDTQLITSGAVPTTSGNLLLNNTPVYDTSNLTADNSSPYIPSDSGDLIDTSISGLKNYQMAGIDMDYMMM